MVQGIALSGLTARCAVMTALWVASAACVRGKDAPTAPNQNVVLDTALIVPAAMKLLSIRTYDGSGQAVHPDYITPAKPWSHRPRYLALTPYPNGNTKYENPVLYSGSDGMNWSVAPGTPNPLVYPKVGYLSDPDVVYANSRGKLFLYYRQTADSDYIHMIRSRDGKQWDAPMKIVAGPLFGVLSPAVVRRRFGEWMMWTVAANGGCRGPDAKVQLRRSTDGMVWSAPEPVYMDLRGYSAWHIDAQWIPSLGEYWALMPVKTYGTCATRQLFIATSKDGVHWITAPNPVARAGQLPEFRDVIYRSTFSFDAALDAVTIWLSGARLTAGDTFAWSTAAVTRPRAELFSDVRRHNMLVPSEHRREVDELFQPPH